ncbi:MAG: orotidine-5'-phosphate decarboxylase [Bdellovibrionaceae bacterium]|nr:orotidine-5'-phosphate decarboxylase [Pseudobdellovibrionaceae bacterium]
MNFYEKLDHITQKNKSFLCVGLDPDLKSLPEIFSGKKNPFFEFNKAIIDATADLVNAYKPQVAYYSAEGLEADLEMTFQYIQKNYPHILTILDSKRGDIDSTARQYARESFHRYQADSVTLNVYMGKDVVTPFMEYESKGLFLLCKTSNPHGGDFQDLKVGEQPLYYHLAKTVSTEWNEKKNLGLVVGGTYIDALKKIRQMDSQLPLLVPGLGAQGGDLKQILDTVKELKNKRIIVNASRSIIYAGKGADFADKSRQKALDYQSVMQTYFK